MSRNKDIKALHIATGKSYKECRAAMKAAKWSYFDAWYIINGGNIFFNLAEVIEGIANAIQEMGQTITKICNSIIEEVRKIQEAQEVES